MPVARRVAEMPGMPKNVPALVGPETSPVAPLKNIFAMPTNACCPFGPTALSGNCCCSGKPMVVSFQSLLSSALERDSPVVLGGVAVERRVAEQAELEVRARGAPEQVAARAVDRLRVEQLANGRETPVVHLEAEELVLRAVTVRVDRQHTIAGDDVDLHEAELRVLVLERADAARRQERRELDEGLRVDESSRRGLRLVGAGHLRDEQKDPLFVGLARDLVRRDAAAREPLQIGLTGRRGDAPEIHRNV